jgi:Protein of unknown function (DUF2612)
MSGPPYPPPPEPGSNGIGFLTIGVSPIGTIPWFDRWRTVISQYGNSDRLNALIESVEPVDPTVNFDFFYDNIWNIFSARGVGLDIWGRIVGVQRVLHVQETGKYFGFAEATGLTVDPFDQSPFYDGTLLTNNFALSDDAFRTLIYAKALTNICDGSIPAINQVLLSLFPDRGNCYCTDGGDMTMTYTFEFTLTDVEAAILVQTEVLPKPAGVFAEVVQL